jgi:hypothetical protein
MSWLEQATLRFKNIMNGPRSRDQAQRFLKAVPAENFDLLLNHLFAHAVNSRADLEVFGPFLDRIVDSNPPALDSLPPETIPILVNSGMKHPTIANNPDVHSKLADYVLSKAAAGSIRHLVIAAHISLPLLPPCKAFELLRELVRAGAIPSEPVDTLFAVFARVERDVSGIDLVTPAADALPAEPRSDLPALFGELAQLLSAVRLREPAFGDVASEVYDRLWALLGIDASMAVLRSRLSENEGRRRSASLRKSISLKRSFCAARR